MAMESLLAQYQEEAREAGVALLSDEPLAQLGAAFEELELELNGLQVSPFPLLFNSSSHPLRVAMAGGVP
jgi:hypothetical protein